jgi:hypothetical protein
MSTSQVVPSEPTQEELNEAYVKEAEQFVNSLVGTRFLFNDANMAIVQQNMRDLDLPISYRSFRAAYGDLMSRADLGGLQLKPEVAPPAAPAPVQAVEPPAKPKHASQAAIQVNGRFISPRASKSEATTARNELFEATRKTDQLIKDSAIRSAQEREINNTVVTGPGGRVNHAKTASVRDALRQKFGRKK